MDLIKKDQRNVLIIFLVLLTLFFGYKMYVDTKDKRSLKNSIIISGRVKEIEYTRGIRVVHVEFYEAGKLIENQFETYNVDSLKVMTLVRLKVSPTNPKGYIEYIGVDDN